jgi:hypothetical protein
MRTGPSVWRTASAWTGFSDSSSGDVVGTALS